jgi:hypothetical protein
MNDDDKAICPICKNKLKEHSELQDKICNMIIIKQFANNCPGFDVQFRPFFVKKRKKIIKSSDTIQALLYYQRQLQELLPV